MKTYIQFSKKQFERMLWMIKSDLSLNCYIKDVTDEFQEFDQTPIWEIIYAIPTYHPRIRLLVFSSIDRHTNKVRSKGQDAVRFVTESTLSTGEKRYTHIKKHLRIQTLDQNMKATISYVMSRTQDKKKKIS